MVRCLCRPRHGLQDWGPVFNKRVLHLGVERGGIEPFLWSDQSTDQDLDMDL